MTIFLIEGKQNSTGNDGDLLPQEFCCTAIEAVNFTNWFDGIDSMPKNFDELLKDEAFNGNWYKLIENTDNFADIIQQFIDAESFLNYEEIVPIGSIPFVHNFVRTIKKFQNKPINEDAFRPLNIPEYLDDLTQRTIYRGLLKNLPKCKDTNDAWFVKDFNIFKNQENGMYSDNPKSEYHHSFYSFNEDSEIFATKKVAVLSEWRVFMFNSKIVGLKHYSGDEWLLPNQNYVQKIADKLAENGLTTCSFDVMIRDGQDWWNLNNKVSECTSSSDGKSYFTDLVEVHEFYAVGLYGFNDYSKLLTMWTRAFRNLLKTS